MTRRRPGNRRRGGFTLVEAIAALFVTTIAVIMAARMFVGTWQTADRSRVLGSIGASATTGTDEILYQLRGASQISTTTLSVQGDSFTPSATQIAFYAPSINTATQDIYTSNSDKIAFNYDSTNQQVTESLDPDSVAGGNGRPTHRKFVIARNVAALSFTYYVRDQFKATSTGTAVCKLSTTYSGTPDIYVNGTKGLGSGAVVYAGTTATVTGITPGADVEFFYQVNPTTNAAGLKYVTEVDVFLATSAPVAGEANRSVTQTCRARLRNVPNLGTQTFSTSTSYSTRL